MHAPALDTIRLIGRVRDMIDRGRLVGARPLLAALKSMAGGQPEIAEIEARLLLREGLQAEALDLLDHALEKFPAERMLRVCRADARMQVNDPMGAADDAASAVLSDRTDPVAKAMLGIALIDLGRLEEAAACLHEAVASCPANPAFRHALATALERGGDPDAAASILAHGVERAPGNVALRSASIMVEMRRRDFERAAALAEAARQSGAIDACVMGLMGHALSSLGRHTEAAVAYGEALKLGPEDPYVRHLVAAAGVLPQTTRAPGAYLEAVFDGYASRFEAHLISLGYRAPGLLRAALLAHLPPSEPGTPVGPVLDLGCGTGLIGVVLSDLELGGLVGVDASSRMLDEARAKGLYTELLHDDLEAMMHRCTDTWPIVMAADVLCYFGALEAVMIAVHAHVPPGGLFLFTVEELAADDVDGPPWQLGRQGRYAHRQDHITCSAAAAGFQVVELRQEALRYEADAPVGGLLVVLRRIRHDS